MTDPTFIIIIQALLIVGLSIEIALERKRARLAEDALLEWQAGADKALRAGEDLGGLQDE